MKNIEPKTLKGFRDFLPNEARKRQYAIDILKGVLELYGFEPLETPAMEYEEILLGKYGEEGDKLMYRFKDLGERKVALRYDQTVPLARVIAQYQNKLPTPFKRYQIQPVWRAENPQKGRFREFLQCDADIVGSSSPLSDAELISVAIKSLEKLGFSNFKILINDRNNFSYFASKMKLSPAEVTDIIRAVDKLKKIGRAGVIDELGKKMGIERAEEIVDSFDNLKPTENLFEIFQMLAKFGIPQERIQFSPTLARGLDYYTGMIFEIEIEEYSAGSVCGGGRYDNLIGMFSRSTSSGQAGKNTPAIGFAFGFDRIMEIMEEKNLFPKELISTKVLVTVFNKALLEKSINILNVLRQNNINSEIYDSYEQKLDKQLKYADQKGIPYVVIIGPDEAEKNQVLLKNFENGEQKTIPAEELPVLLNLTSKGSA